MNFAASAAHDKEFNNRPSGTRSVFFRFPGTTLSLVPGYIQSPLRGFFRWTEGFVELPQDKIGTQRELLRLAPLAQGSDPDRIVGSG
jgi:hypothetical protein